MNISPNQRFVFDTFLLDTENLSLYYRNELIRKTERKCLEVLAVLLENANQPASHELIIGRVWKDDPFGKSSLNTAQCVRKLRKLLAEYAPDKNYIETIKGTGYMFGGEVSLEKSEVREPVEEINPLNGLDEDFDFSIVQRDTEPITEKGVPAYFNSKTAFVLLSIIPVFLIVFIGWMWFSENNEEEVKQVVKESQLYESLVIYKNPSTFDESALDKYWTSELEISANYDRQRIREAVQKLKTEGRRYGNDTKCEMFEFQSVEINKDENFAVVKTLEKWFISVYFDDGTLQKNKTVGPYFVSYILRKIDGRWLIEKSNTARVNRPTPQLSEIILPSELKANEQFLFNLKGRDFEPATIFIEITGENCSENNSCKISNPDLREKAKLSETSIKEIPMTLASGDYKILVRNGDSKPSAQMLLTIP